MEISLGQDRKLAWRGGGSYRYARLRLMAPRLAGGPERPALNLALVLDRSGSMAGEKIVFARQALDALAAGLDGRDHAALVIFDHEVVTLTPAQGMGDGGSERLRRLLAGVEARGNTALFDGWLHGAREAALVQDRASLSRVILVSDGLANTGITDRSVIAGHVGELRRRGISTSTIGVGIDFDEVLLCGMAEMGGGNFHFVEAPAAIPAVIRAEFGELLRPYGQGIAVRVSVPAGLRVQGWNEVPAEGGPLGTTFYVGDLAQGMETDLILNVIFPEGEAGASTQVEIEVTWTDVASGACRQWNGSLRYRWARGEENEAQPRDADVALRVVEVWAARIRRAALERNRSGAYADAGQLVRDETRFLQRYARGLAGVERFVGEVDLFAREVSAPMGPAALKRTETRAYQAARMKPDYTVEPPMPTRREQPPGDGEGEPVYEDRRRRGAGNRD